MTEDFVMKLKAVAGALLALQGECEKQTGDATTMFAWGLTECVNQLIKDAENMMG